MHASISNSKGLPKAPQRARKGKLAGLLALGGAVCLIASPLKTIEPAKASIKLKTIDYQIYALNKLRDLKQFNCLLKLYSKESAWNPSARNGTHYGIPQGNSTWLRTQTGMVQVDWGINYIHHRYGMSNGMCNAYKHWSKHGWH